MQSSLDSQNSKQEKHGKVKYIQQQQKPKQGRMQNYLRLLVDRLPQPNSRLLLKEMTKLQLNQETFSHPIASLLTCMSRIKKPQINRTAPQP
jgi:hypothetical protein